jgi:hypothetical protein
MIKLPTNIIRKGASESAASVLGRRWTVLQAATASFFEAQGFQVQPLKNARYLLTKAGEPSRTVAVKTAADRWPNGSVDTIGDAETIYIAAFYPRFNSYDTGKPTRLQIAEVDASAFVKQAQTVRANKNKLNQSGQVFMPLDEEQLKDSPNNIGCSAGHVLQNGKIVLDEPIAWEDQPPPTAVPAGNQTTTSSASPLSAYQTLIDHHRGQIENELTKLGLPVSDVRIEVTLA